MGRSLHGGAFLRDIGIDNSALKAASWAKRAEEAEIRRSIHGGGFPLNILIDFLNVYSDLLGGGPKLITPKKKALPLLVASILLSLAGVGAFLWIFGRDFNIYWLILSPIIIVLYQFPAVFVFRLYRQRLAKAKKAEDRPAGEGDGNPGRP